MLENKTAARIAVIRGRLGAATPGPWDWQADAASEYGTLYGRGKGHGNGVHDAKLVIGLHRRGRKNPANDLHLIASAPADLAWACEEIERLTRERDEARAALAELVRLEGPPDDFPCDAEASACASAWAEARRIVGEGGAL